VRDAVKLYRSSNQVFKAMAETHIYSRYFHWEKGVPIKFHQRTFYYIMKKKSVMSVRRDERVTPEIIVRDFRPGRYEWAWLIIDMIEQIRMEGIEIMI